MKETAPKKKNGLVIALWCVVAVLLVGGLVWWFWPKDKSPDVTAEIWIDGKLIDSIHLPDAPDGDISLEPYGHHVTLSVQDHAICFLHSDCPDKRCVHTGWLRYEGDQSTCLPNRTTVILVSGDTVPVELPGTPAVGAD